MKLEFSQQIFEKTEISGFVKTRPVGAKLFSAGKRTYRQTNITKLIVFFRNFANEPKNWKRDYSNSVTF
jgi:hypothetical protein